MRVLNQFKFDEGRGRAACVPICLLALYHIAEEIRDDNNYQCASILNHTQWTLVMRRGTRLWELWKQSAPANEVFATTEEILALPACNNIYKLFKKTDWDERDRAGLAIQSKLIENKQGSLQALFRSMALAHRDGYAVVIMPVYSSAVAVFYYHKANRFFLFDPHGAQGHDYITLLRFMDHRDVVRYLVVRYDISSIDHYQLEQHNENVLYDETELCEMFSYSASLFTTIQ